MSNKISFIGLGKLGLPLACVLASADNKVLCLDKNEHILNLLSNDILPFYEPDLDKLMSEVKHNIVGYTDSYRKAIETTSAAIILVNTQLGDDGYSSDFVEAAVSDIAINLKLLNKDYFTIILSSTVLPGTIHDKLIPLVENISGKKYGEGFGFSYVPDFVKLGCVIKDFQNPEFFLIGANSDRDYNITKSIFKGIHSNGCSQHRMTLEEAEVAKVALNAYIVNKITFANFLGRLCEEMDNVNVHNVTKVIGIDRRISPYFFKSGTPYGGTCFPRDTWAFIKFARDQNLEAKNLIFAEEVNELVYEHIYNSLKEYDDIGFLGISFKPNSPVTIGSPSRRLIKRLLKDNKKIHGYDKIQESYDNLNLDIRQYKTPQECVENCQIVVIMHPDSDFGILDYGNVEVIDSWGIINKNGVK